MKMNPYKKAAIVYQAMNQPLHLDFKLPKSAMIAGEELQMSIKRLLKE